MTEQQGIQYRHAYNQRSIGALNVLYDLQSTHSTYCTAIRKSLHICTTSARTVLKRSKYCSAVSTVLLLDKTCIST
jgi:hypothetical protein